VAKQASDGNSKGDDSGFKLGDLDLGAKPARGPARPARSPSQQIPAIGGLAPSDGGRRSQSALQPAQAQAEAAQARAHAEAQAKARAQAQAQAEAQARARAQAQAATLARKPENQQGAATKIAGGGQVAALDVDPAEAGLALELDLDRGPVKQGTPATQEPGASHLSFGDRGLGDGFGDERTGPLLELAEVAPVSPGGVTGGRAEGKDEAKRSAAAVVELAGYGDLPDGPIGAVRYAVHVARRVMVLRKEREKAKLDAVGLEADLNAAFVDMGKELMTLQTDPVLAPLRSKIAAVIEAQTKVSSADQSMAKTREQNQLALAELDEEAARIRVSLEPYLQAEQAALDAHKKAEDELKRAQVQQRRVEIELRALTEAKSVQDPARAADLSAALEQRKQVVMQASAVVQQKAGALGQARRELALQKGALDSVEDRKRRILDDASKKEAEVEKQAKDAEGTHATALRSLAENARELELAQKHAPERLEWVVEIEQAVADAHLVVKRYDKALTLYDRPTVVRGAAYAGSAALLLLASVLVLLLS
jgi:hypothetical protein